MLKIKVGGVPEHFNYPWLKCIEKNKFQNVANVEWLDCLGGTGEMADALENGNIDLAIMLTEGSIKQIESGKPFKIIQKYIETPLVWGIHTSANETFSKVSDLEKKTAAISRYNSGSHLMTHVLADRESWDLSSLNFKVCHNLEGAINALNNQNADYLLWERFTTKPYVDNNILKHLGDCLTPWPCFVIVVRDNFYRTNQVVIDSILEVLNNQTKKLKQNPKLSEILSQRYKLKKVDTDNWLNQTQWSQSSIKSDTIQELKTKLMRYNIIS